MTPFGLVCNTIRTLHICNKCRSSLVITQELFGLDTDCENVAEMPVARASTPALTTRLAVTYKVTYGDVLQLVCPSQVSGICLRIGTCCILVVSTWNRAG
jgi:hypothetical protein